MIVVSDTSPITNLIQIDKLALLHAVFGEIIIPKTIYDELCEIEEQKKILEQQHWIAIAPAQNRSLVVQLETDLGKGEAEAIALALELNSDFLIIDEIKGRTIAEKLGVRIVGLLGTLLKAKEQGHLNAIKPELEKLSTLGFRINPKLFEHLLNLAGEE